MAERAGNLLQGGVASMIKRRPSPATRTSRYRRCRGRYHGPTRMRGQEERRVWLVGCISALQKKTTPSSEEGERCFGMPYHMPRNLRVESLSPGPNEGAVANSAPAVTLCPFLLIHLSMCHPAHHATLVPSSVLPQHPLCNIYPSYMLPTLDGVINLSLS